jgi:ketosteroid isomerase-like protein
MKKLVFSVLVATTLFACKSNSETKPAFDLAAAKTEIAAANQNYEALVSKMDSVGLAKECYTADAKLMNPNEATAVGTKEIQSVFSAIMSSGITGIKIETTEIWGDENNITEEGLLTINIKDGTVVGKGKYLVLWKKEDGKWKIHRDAYSFNTPPAPPAPAAK